MVEARAGAAPGLPGWVNGFGGWVITEHVVDEKMLHVVYGHLYPQDILVQQGQMVQRGQRVARVGNNGDSSAAHLHGEVWIGGRYKGEAVDPAPWWGLEP